MLYCSETIAAVATTGRVLTYRTDTNVTRSLAAGCVGPHAPPTKKLRATRPMIERSLLIAASWSSASAARRRRRPPARRMPTPNPGS